MLLNVVFSKVCLFLCNMELMQLCWDERSYPGASMVSGSSRRVLSIIYWSYTGQVLGWKVIPSKHNRGDFYSQFIMNFKWKQIFLTLSDFKCMCPGGQMFPGHMSPRTPVIPEHLSYPDTCLPGQKCPDMCYPDTFSPDKWGCTVIIFSWSCCQPQVQIAAKCRSIKKDRVKIRLI